MTALTPPAAAAPYTGLLRREDAPGPHAGMVVMITGLLGLTCFMVVPVVLTAFVYGIGWLARGRQGSYAAYASRAARFENPEGMLGAHLGLASLILVTFVLLRWGVGLAPRWVCSVQPGMRWRYLLLALVASLAIIATVLWVSQLRTAGAPHPQPSFGWFLTVILLTTPLQAAGEEFFFRGFLLPVIGSVSRQPWIGIVVSALLFALVHGTQDLPLFCDRLAFGLLAGWLVVATGGLEAAIAAHVANNLIAFISAGMWGTIAQARTVSTMTWPQAAIDISTFAAVALVGWLLGRGLHVACLTPRDASSGLN